MILSPKDLEKLNSEIKNLQNKKIAEEERIKQLFEQKIALIDSITELNGVIAKRNEDIKAVDRDIEKLKKDKVSEEKDLDSVIAQTEKRRSEIRELEKIQNDRDKKQDEREVELNRKDNQLTQIENNQKRLDAELNSKKRDIDLQESKIRGLLEDINKREASLKVRESGINSKMELLEITKREISGREKDVRSGVLDNNAKAHELDVLAQTLDKMRDHLSGLKIAVLAIESKNTKKESELAGREEALERNIASLESDKRALEIKRLRVEKIIRDNKIETELESLQKSINT